MNVALYEGAASYIVKSLHSMHVLKDGTEVPLDRCVAVMHLNPGPPNYLFMHPKYHQMALSLYIRAPSCACPCNKSPAIWSLY